MVYQNICNGTLQPAFCFSILLVFMLTSVRLAKGNTIDYLEWQIAHGGAEYSVPVARFRADSSEKSTLKTRSLPFTGEVTVAGKSGQLFVICAHSVDPEGFSRRVMAVESTDTGEVNAYVLALAGTSGELSIHNSRPCPNQLQSQYLFSSVQHLTSDTPFLLVQKKNAKKGARDESPLFPETSDTNPGTMALLSGGISDTGDHNDFKRPPFMPALDKASFDLLLLPTLNLPANWREFLPFAGVYHWLTDHNPAGLTILVRFNDQPPVRLQVSQAEYTDMAGYLLSARQLLNWLVPKLNGREYLVQQILELLSGEYETVLPEETLEAVQRQLAIVLEQPDTEFSLEFEYSEFLQTLAGQATKQQPPGIHQLGGVQSKATQSTVSTSDNEGQSSSRTPSGRQGSPDPQRQPGRLDPKPDREVSEAGSEAVPDAPIDYFIRMHQTEYRINRQHVLGMIYIPVSVSQLRLFCQDCQQQGGIRIEEITAHSESHRVTCGQCQQFRPGAGNYNARCRMLDRHTESDCQIYNGFELASPPADDALTVLRFMFRFGIEDSLLDLLQQPDLAVTSELLQQRDQYQRTILHDLAQHTTAPVIGNFARRYKQLIIVSNALHMQDAEGNTPLHHLFEVQSETLALEFIKHFGGQLSSQLLTATNNWGATLLDILIQRSFFRAASEVSDHLDSQPDSSSTDPSTTISQPQYFIPVNDDDNDWLTDLLTGRDEASQVIASLPFVSEKSSSESSSDSSSESSSGSGNIAHKESQEQATFSQSHPSTTIEQMHFSSSDSEERSDISSAESDDSEEGQKRSDTHKLYDLELKSVIVELAKELPLHEDNQRSEKQKTISTDLFVKNQVKDLSGIEKQRFMILAEIVASPEVLSESRKLFLEKELKQRLEYQVDDECIKKIKNIRRRVRDKILAKRTSQISTAEGRRAFAHSKKHRPYIKKYLRERVRRGQLGTKPRIKVRALKSLHSNIPKSFIFKTLKSLHKIETPTGVVKSYDRELMQKVDRNKFAKFVCTRLPHLSEKQQHVEKILELELTTEEIDKLIKFRRYLHIRSSGTKPGIEPPPARLPTPEVSIQAVAAEPEPMQTAMMPLTLPEAASLPVRAPVISAGPISDREKINNFLQTHMDSPSATGRPSLLDFNLLAKLWEKNAQALVSFIIESNIRGRVDSFTATLFGETFTDQEIRELLKIRRHFRNKLSEENKKLVSTVEAVKKSEARSQSYVLEILKKKQSKNQMLGLFDDQRLSMLAEFIEAVFPIGKAGTTLREQHAQTIVQGHSVTPEAVIKFRTNFMKHMPKPSPIKTVSSGGTRTKSSSKVALTVKGIVITKESCLNQLKLEIGKGPSVLDKFNRLLLELAEIVAKNYSGNRSKTTVTEDLQQLLGTRATEQEIKQLEQLRMRIIRRLQASLRRR